MAQIRLSETNIAQLKGHQFHTTVRGLDQYFRFRVGDRLNLLASPKAHIEPYCAICLGNYLWTMGSFSYSWSVLPMDTRMGRYCSVAKNVTAMGVSHPVDRISTSIFSYDPNFSIFKFSNEHLGKGPFATERNRSDRGAITIEQDVWIGEGAVLGRGITIGTGAVIGQRALVTRDVAPYAIVGGIPARLIRYRFDDQTIERLLRLQWWRYAYPDFNGIDFNLPIQAYLDALEQRMQEGVIQPYSPEVLKFSDLVANRIPDAL